MFRPPDTGMDCRGNSESSLEQIIDFSEKTSAHTSTRQQNTPIFVEKDEDTFQNFYSEYDNITINCSPMKNL